MKYYLQIFTGIFKALRKIYIHRKAVWKAGRLLGVPTMRLLKHDNSKFHPIEFIHYVKRFETDRWNKKKWAKAWEHHWRHNDHHIEYWVEKQMIFSWVGFVVQNTNRGFTGIGGGVPHEGRTPRWGVWMPDDAIREMIADWMAASFAYAGEWPKAPNWNWGNNNLVKMLKKLEITSQPETSTRGFAVQLLQLHEIITQEQVSAVLVI